MDPRVKTPQEALVRQFELASQLSAKQGEVSMALQQAAELRKQIEARKKEASEKADTAKALEELKQKLEGMVAPDGNAGFGLFGLALPSKEQEALPKVAAALANLIIIVESADAAPTTDASTASEKWDKAAEETLAQWAAFQKQDLVKANALLQKASLKPLVTVEPAAPH
jgi:hypothetical protein